MSENKAIELQLQVRRNAQEYQNSVKDLYSWEKEIKSKEEALKNAPAPTINTDVSNAFFVIVKTPKQYLIYMI